MEEFNKNINPLEKPQKKLTAIQLIGINLGVMLLVAIIGFSAGEGGIIVLMFAIPIQFLGCLIAAAIDRNRWPAWVISAFLCGIIGFSTCVGGLSLA